MLADELGPFGNPSSDSERAAVTPSTRSLWLVIFAPRSVPQDTMAAHVGAARARLERHLAPPGETVGTWGAVVPRAQ